MSIKIRYPWVTRAKAKDEFNESDVTRNPDGQFSSGSPSKNTGKTTAKDMTLSEKVRERNDAAQRKRKLQREDKNYARKKALAKTKKKKKLKVDLANAAKNRDAKAIVNARREAKRVD